jgi:hypothetical protein
MDAGTSTSMDASANSASMDAGLPAWDAGATHR